jgi:hypothetical protein
MALKAIISYCIASRSKERLELLLDWLFAPLIIRIIGVPLLIAIELNRIVRTTIDWLIDCFLDCSDLWAGIRSSIISLVLSIVVSPLLLKALIKRDKLILIYTIIAFIDKGKRYLVFIKGLTLFKYILDSTINQSVLLIRLLEYYSRLFLAGISKLYII